MKVFFFKNRRKSSDFRVKQRVLRLYIKGITHKKKKN